MLAQEPDKFEKRFDCFQRQQGLDAKIVHLAVYIDPGRARLVAESEKKGMELLTVDVVEQDAKLPFHAAPFAEKINQIDNPDFPGGYVSLIQLIHGQHFLLLDSSRHQTGNSTLLCSEIQLRIIIQPSPNIIPLAVQPEHYMYIFP